MAQLFICFFSHGQVFSPLKDSFKGSGGSLDSQNDANSEYLYEVFVTE